MIVADTDVLIDYLSDCEPAASVIATELARGALHTTAITRFELLSGTRSTREETVVRQLLAGLATLPVDEAAADQAAVVRKSLERRGESIGMADSLIAGVVMAAGGSLLTRNRRHFERVPELSLAALE